MKLGDLSKVCSSGDNYKIVKNKNLLTMNYGTLVILKEKNYGKE